MDLSGYTGRNWENHYVDSIIPEVCKSEPCVLGVDEAGRGPVLGPMAYGICFCPVSQHEDLKKSGVADSKTLSEEQREKIFGIIHSKSDSVGWSLDMISPMYISNCMYKRPKVSLNEVSHNSAINLIKRAVAAGVQVAEVYVDTVGPPEKYQAKLEEIFPTMKITVAKKADSLFPCVSGASICAKVGRDRALKSWEFPEETTFKDWGSGYPGDALTKNFLNNTIDRVFGFPAIVRFSWSTAEKIMDEKCVPMTWKEDDEEEKEDKPPSVLSFFARKDAPGPIKTTSRKRHHFFTDRCIRPVSSF